MKRFIFFCFLFLFFSCSFILADSFKPYLHDAVIPQHPSFDLSGKYSTNLYPGSAVYNYALDVPPGTNGLRPSLTLYYNSQAVTQAPDILGAGWMLSQDLLARNINGSDTITDDFFTLILAGQSYDLVYDASSGVYHTLAESNMRIQNMTGVNDYWLVTLKDGTQYRFGYSSDSELLSNTGKNFSLQWSLDLVTDTHGNTINYTYLHNPFSGDNGTQYLSTVTYNRDGQRQINLSYEANMRPDGRTVYQQSNEVNITRRLSAITVSANNAPVHVYRFAYNTLDTSTGLSSLANISEYGTDNITLISTNSFGYYSPTAGYTNTTSAWIPPELFSELYTNDYGVRLVDVNNDGQVDIVKSLWATGQKTVWLRNATTGWENTTEFIVPAWIADTNHADFGTRFLDLNNDGFIDLLWSEETWEPQRAWLNNGTGWVNASDPWAMPADLHFVSFTYSDMGVDTLDLNGDHRQDLVRNYAVDLGSSTNVTAVYLNTGNGWVNGSSLYTLPVVTLENDTSPDTGVRFLDLNNDGLTDIIQAIQFGDSRAPAYKAWLNTGSGWRDVSGAWTSPVPFVAKKAGGGEYDNGVRFADLNGDGLVDMVQNMQNATAHDDFAWLNTGHGWVRADQWHSPDAFVVEENNIGRRFADVSGDGLADLVVSYGNGLPGTQAQYTWVKNETYPYLLANITGSFGGVTSVYYNRSTLFNNTAGDSDSSSDLGFNVYVVSSTTVNNSLSSGFNTLAVTNYSYANGLFDPRREEFRGFGLTNESLADGTFVMHYFFQSDALQGKEYRTITYNSSLAPFLRDEKGYSAVLNGSYYIVHMDNETVSSFDGLATNPLQVNSSYTYDGYGNVLAKTYSGGTKSEAWDYYANTSSWIVNKVKKYHLLDSGNDVQLVVYSYDGKQNQGPQSLGELTRVDAWLSTSGTGTQTSTYTYDSYGNMLTSMDALGRVTTYSYGLHDDTHTFKEREMNALGQQTDYRYDLGTGDVLSSQRNGITTYTYYDNASRLWKTVEAYDTFLSPTLLYNYSFDGVAPEKVQVFKKINENETQEIDYWYDGFGNFVQMKEEAEGNLSVVHDYLYDGLLRVKAVSVPHYENTSSDFTLLSSYTTNYSYDPLGRVVQVRNPDGTTEKVTFVHNNITTTDELGHKKTYFLDAYDRIIAVYEYNNDALLNSTVNTIYNTSYSYDVADHLLSITDNQSHVFLYSYDSLGRRTSLSDPDLGNWSYSYDSVGNLIQQIDSRGNSTNFTYDKLNRIINKKNVNEEVNFSYDGQFLGTLSNVTDNGMKYVYIYDNKYRKIDELWVADGQTFDTGKTYDGVDRIVTEKLNATTLGYDYAVQGPVKSIPGFVNLSVYTAFGSLQNMTYFNAQNTTYTYNSSTLRLTQIKTGVIQNLNYAYDSKGNIKKINDTVNTRAEEMTYDNLDRLTNVTVGPNMSATYRYVYDEVGNVLMIIKNSNTTTRFIYDGRQAHAPSAIVDNLAGAMVYNPTRSATNVRNMTYQFYLVNARNITLTGINWTVDFGDGNTQTGSGVNLNASQYQRIQVTHLYSNGSDYQVNVTTVWNGTVDSTSTADLSFGVKPSALLYLNQSTTNTTFTLKIKNTLSVAVNDVNWTCSNYTRRVNLSANQELPINFSLTETVPGYNTLNCVVNSTDGNNVISTVYKVRGIEISDENTSSVAGDKKQITFVLKNYFNTMQVNWSVDSDGMQQKGNVTVNASGLYQLTKQFNYTKPGLKILFVNASGLGFYDNRTDSLLLRGLEVENSFTANKTYQDKIYMYDVRNYWGNNLSVNWTMSDPVLNNTLVLNMTSNGTLFVFIENNYTSSGNYAPTFMIYNGSINATATDRFIAKLIEILRVTPLHQYVTNTTVEFVIKNNVQRQNVTWILNTGIKNISSNFGIDLNSSQQVFVIVNYNYSNVGGYVATAYTNSSTLNDSLAVGVVV